MHHVVKRVATQLLNELFLRREVQFDEVNTLILQIGL